MKPSWRIPLIFLGAFATSITLGATLIVAKTLSFKQNWIVFIILGIFLAFSISLFYQGLRSRLVLTTDSIVYFQPHFKIEAKWDETEKFIKNSNRLILVCRNPAFRGNPALKWGITKLGPWDRIIPIDPYINIKEWENTLFKDSIMQHAPHLLP